MQLRIEAQGKYLQAVLEKAQETLGRQNLGAAGLEAAKVQLSELVSKVSTQCLNSAFAELKEVHGLCPQQAQPTHPPNNNNNNNNDCSMDSCLTCEGSQKDHEMAHNNGLVLRPYSGATTASFLEPKQGYAEELIKPRWCNEARDDMFASERRMFPAERGSSGLSIGIGLEGDRGVRERWNAKDGLVDRGNSGTRGQDSSNVPYFSAKLDLNAHQDHENDSSSSGCKQFDLNGFSWN